MNVAQQSEVSFWPKSKWWWTSLVAIVLIAGALRYIGATYSLPYIEAGSEPTYTVAGNFMLTLGSAKAIGMQGYPPGIIVVNYVLLRWFHDPSDSLNAVIGPIRLLAVTFSLVSLCLTALIGHRMNAPFGGLIAALICAVNPAWIRASQIANSDTFVTCFMLAAIFLVSSGILYRRSRLITYSSIFMILAVIFKYQAAFAGPVIGLAPLLRLRGASPQERVAALRNFWTNCAMYGAFFFWLIVIYPATEVGSSPHFTADPSRFGIPDLARVAEYLGLVISPYSLIYIVLALIGFGALLNRQFRGQVYFPVVGILAGTGLLWFIGVSFWDKQSVRQFIFAGYVLAVLSGLGIEGLKFLLGMLTSRVSFPASVSPRIVREGLITLLALGISLPHIARSVEMARRNVLWDRRNDLMGWADATLMPGKVIAPVPFHVLFDRSWGGYEGTNDFEMYQRELVTTRPLAEWRNEGVSYAVVPYDDYVLLQSSRDGQKYLDEMTVLKTYQPSPDYRDPGMTVLSLSPISLPVTNGRLGTIQVLGINLSGTSLSRGDNLELTLFWRAEAPTDIPYWVYVHLVPQSDRQIVAQNDGLPLFDERRPTSTWNDPDEVLLSHPFILTIGPNVAPGRYRLMTGFFDPVSGQRLQSPDGEDFILLAVIEVTK